MQNGITGGVTNLQIGGGIVNLKIGGGIVNLKIGGGYCIQYEIPGHDMSAHPLFEYTRDLNEPKIDTHMRECSLACSG